MEILKLNKEEYEGFKFVICYLTSGYYDIARNSQGFLITYKQFENVQERSFEDVLYGEWLEDPLVYGAFENGKLLGIVEGSLESWNHRYRISNIHVFDEENRHLGIGTKLMKTILETAKETAARMVVLETQTCNEKAISFYQKHGFDIIGFDLYSYSNEDVKNCEVRIEMGKMI